MKEKRRDLIINQLKLYKGKYSEFVKFNEILEQILHRIAKQISTEYLMQKRVKLLNN